MERIASFTVDHTVLTPGLYLSRQDGDADIVREVMEGAEPVLKGATKWVK